MPTILVAGPYRMYFYSHEPNEPHHVHVDATINRRSSGSSLSRSPETSALVRRSSGESIGWSSKTAIVGWRNGMNASHPSPGERVRDVHCTEGLVGRRPLRRSYDYCSSDLVPTALGGDSRAAIPLEDQRRRLWNSLAGHRRGLEYRRPATGRSSSGGACSLVPVAEPG